MFLLPHPKHPQRDFIAERVVYNRDVEGAGMSLIYWNFVMIYQSNFIVIAFSKKQKFKIRNKKVLCRIAIY